MTPDSIVEHALLALDDSTNDARSAIARGVEDAKARLQSGLLNISARASPSRGAASAESPSGDAFAQSWDDDLSGEFDAHESIVATDEEAGGFVDDDVLNFASTSDPSPTFEGSEELPTFEGDDFNMDALEVDDEGIPLG